MSQQPLAQVRQRLDEARRNLRARAESMRGQAMQAIPNPVLGTGLSSPRVFAAMPAVTNIRTRIETIRRDLQNRLSQLKTRNPILQRRGTTTKGLITIAGTPVPADTSRLLEPSGQTTAIRSF